MYPNSLLLFLLFFSGGLLKGQGVRISDDPGDPHPSAILDLRSDSKGLLIPSMTSTERGDINQPYDGLMIYNISEGFINIYDGVEQEWQVLQPLRDPPPPEPTIPAVQSMVLTGDHFGPSELFENSIYTELDDVVFLENTLYGRVSAPLYLPVGTIISSITVYFRDTQNGPVQMHVRLRARTLGGISEFYPASFSSNDVAVSPNIQSINLNVGHTMLPNRGYSIGVSGSFNVDQGIQGVLINYTLPTN